MTHFAVLVVGDDVEKRLAPYDESIEVDPRWEEDDFCFTLAAHLALADLAGTTPYSDKDTITREQIREKAESITAEEAVKVLNVHDEPGRYRNNDGRIERQTTYNPDAKWDWWVIGGRFNNYWSIRKPCQGDESCVSYDSNGGLMTPVEHRMDRADSAMIKAIDFVSMTNEAMKRGRGFHETIYRTVNELGPIPPIPTLEEGTREAFQEWWDTPVVKTLVERLWDDPPIMLSPDDIVGPSEMHTDDYVHYCAASAVIPYAVLDDDGWHAPGEMGFWGMSTDRFHDRVKFATDLYDKIWDLSDDTWLTIVDAHI